MRGNFSQQEGRGAMWRSRWAAIGASVAVALGGGGVLIANAASGPASAVVTITPVRILDTRDPSNIGLAGPFVSAVSQDLKVTGSVPTTSGPQVVVPDGATGVLLNVTAVNPTAAGFISVRPSDAPGSPTTSSLNVNAGDIMPNAVTVQLPTSGADQGKIELTFDAYGIAGPRVDILVDVVGYMQLGAPGPKGDTGDPGAPGPKGDTGDPGASGYEIVEKTFTIPANNFGLDDVQCPASKKPVGGGFYMLPNQAPTGTVTMTQSTYNVFGNGWIVDVNNTNDFELTGGHIFVICLSVT